MHFCLIANWYIYNDFSFTMQSHTDFLGHRRYNFLTFILSYETFSTFQKLLKLIFPPFLQFLESFMLLISYFFFFLLHFLFFYFLFLDVFSSRLYSIFHSFIIKFILFKHFSYDCSKFIFNSCLKRHSHIFHTHLHMQY